MLEPQIVKKPSLHFVGLEAAFIHGLSPEANNFQVIPRLWDDFGRRAREVPGRVGEASYGVIYERPEAERAHPHELQYVAAVQVASPGSLPEGMIAHTVPAATFAVFVHRGSIAGIADTCRQIYRVWLPQSGWQHAGIADVELYDERFHCESDASEMEYWISVVPK